MYAIGVAWLIPIAAVLWGQANGSLGAYLHLRRAYGIHEAVSEEALESFVGNRIVEVAGTVRGVMGFGQTSQILLEKTDQETLSITAKSVPDWLQNGSPRARLIVKASRPDENAPLDVSLVAVEQEANIIPIEQQEQEAERKRELAQRQKLAAAPKSFAARRVWTLPASEAEGYYAAFIQRRNPHLSSAKAMEIARGILGFSIHFGVDARLIMAMVMVESGFNPQITSRAGARGLGQLMPGTARLMGVSNSYDTIDNLYGTVKLVRNHLNNYARQTGDEFQTLVLTLAAYNAGPGAVLRHGGVPPYRETQNYIRKVIRLYRQFRGY